MHHFVNFCNNNSLFKCEPQEFKMIIQKVFNEILTAPFTHDDHVNVTRLKINNPNRRCIICSHFVNTSYFVICKHCTKQCIGLNVDFNFGNYDDNCALACDKKKLFDELVSKRLVSNDCVNNSENDLCLECYSPNILSECAICDLCGSLLAKINVGLSISSFIINDGLSYAVFHKDTIDDDLLSSRFIAHLPELCDRFFNTTMIIFIMALTDSTSAICALNNDILMYTFSFIY